MANTTVRLYIRSYAVLESFDKGSAAPIVRQPIAPTGTDRTAAYVKALDGFLRSGTMATDTPLQIQQSPIIDPATKYCHAA